MRWIILLTVLLSGCAITIKPLPPVQSPKKKSHKVSHHHNKISPHPKQTPEPKSPTIGMPPYPPPNWDEIVRRTHPTPTISPYDFQ